MRVGELVGSLHGATLKVSTNEDVEFKEPRRTCITLSKHSLFAKKFKKTMKVYKKKYIYYKIKIK